MSKIASVGAWIALALICAVMALAVTSNPFFLRAVQFGFPAALVVTHVTLAIHNHVDAEARLLPVLLTIAAFVLILPSSYVIFVLANNWSNEPPPAPHDGAAQMGIYFSALFVLFALIVASVAALFASLAGRLTGRLSALPWRIAGMTLVCWVVLILGMLAQVSAAAVAAVVSATLLSLAWWVCIATQGWLESILSKLRIQA